MRDSRCVIPDLRGKGKRLRLVPAPGWVKERIDFWTTSAAIKEKTADSHDLRHYAAWSWVARVQHPQDSRLIPERFRLLIRHSAEHFYANGAGDEARAASIQGRIGGLKMGSAEPLRGAMGIEWIHGENRECRSLFCLTVCGSLAHSTLEGGRSETTRERLRTDANPM
jgi:hypothetical protein